MSSSPSQPVLVVEDEPSMRLLLSSLLERAGFQALAAASVDEAEAVLRSHPVSLVVSDYALGAGTGLELLQVVRSERPGLPFVLVSAALPDGVPERARRSGADRVLPKQQLVGELVELVAQAAA